MAIGQVTISAADWIASRVSDRMALALAGQQSTLAQQGGGKSIQPVEDNAGSHMERRERERAALAAQESYARVAARIKSRLASRIDAQEQRPGAPAQTPADRNAILESVKDNPKLVTSIIASEQKSESQQAQQPQQAGQQRPEPLFGLAEADQKKTDAEDAKKERAEKDAILRADEERRERRRAEDAEPLFEKGLWDDLFYAREIRDAPRIDRTG